MVQPSPYTPGVVAREVPGRHRHLAEFEERLSYLADLRQLVPRIHIDHAPRGYGKTSLLRRYEELARARQVTTVWVTAGEPIGLIRQLVEGLERVADSGPHQARRILAQRIEKVTLSLGLPGVAKADLTVSNNGRETAAPQARAFEDLIRAAAGDDSGTGLLLFIDEIQAADRAGLRTLLYAWQHLQAEGRDVPAGVFAAGLPNSPDAITAVITFSERVAFRELEPLSAEAQEIALVLPARALGVGWTPQALTEALSVAAGYPYFLQLIGDAAWSAAGRPDPGGVIDVDAVGRGRDVMRQDTAALFRSRWTSASPGERKLLAAMAQLGDHPVGRADIARVMQVAPRSLSVTRHRLIDKGLVEAPERGLLQFTIPGFAAYVRSLDD